MDGKIEIVICLGSSCFSRGNKESLQIIHQYIKDNKLENKVYFHGGHCFGDCQKGPILKINNKIIEDVKPTEITEILDSVFNI